MNPGKKASGWTYNHFALWVLSTFFSFCIMFIVIWVPIAILFKVLGPTVVVNGVTHSTDDYLGQFVAIPLIAVGVGLIQYLILRFSLARMGVWFWVTSFGWLLAFAGVVMNFSAVYLLPQNPVASSLLLGIFIGLVIGLIQWMVLRAHATRSGWIIAGNALGWGIASMIMSHSVYFTTMILAMTIPNLFSGLAFYFLIGKRPAGRDAKMPSNGQTGTLQQSLLQ